MFKKVRDELYAYLAPKLQALNTDAVILYDGGKYDETSKQFIRCYFRRNSASLRGLGTEVDRFDCSLFLSVFTPSSCHYEDHMDYASKVHAVLKQFRSEHAVIIRDLTLNDIGLDLGGAPLYHSNVSCNILFDN